MASIGIMGGTFNPIHLGHIELAKAAYEQYSLDKVIFMPAGCPPHKSSESIASSHHRLAMVNLAIKPYSYFESSDFEIRMEGRSYTANTLIKLHKLYPENQFYFLMGGDSFFQFNEWHKPDVIAQNCIILVADRGDYTREQWNEQKEHLMKDYCAQIERITLSPIPMSSTDFRNNIAQFLDMNSKELVKHFIIPEVFEYIRRNHLYCTD